MPVWLDISFRTLLAIVKKVYFYDKKDEAKADLPNQWNGKSAGKAFILGLFVFQLLNAAFHLLNDLVRLLRYICKKRFSFLILSW